MSTSYLKRKLKYVSNAISESHSIRLHRAISWLKAADEFEKNPDVRLICLWVSINSLYAIDEARTEQMLERERFGDFVDRLLICDDEKRLYNILWNKFTGPVRMLIENQYVYGPFWDFQRGTGRNWERGFQQSIIDANNALSNQNVPYLLRIVLDRLYVLRNQLIHGGATYNSKVNRAQVRDGANLLAALLPVVIELMILNSDRDWGRIYYPPLV